MGLSNAWLGQIVTDLAGATVKLLLVGPSYVFDPTHAFVADVAADESTGGTYVRKTLSGMSAVQNDTDDRGEFYFDNVVYTALSTTEGHVDGAWVYEFVTTDADSPLRFFLDFSKATNGQDITIRPPSVGGLWTVAGS